MARRRFHIYSETIPRLWMHRSFATLQLTWQQRPRTFMRCAIVAPVIVAAATRDTTAVFAAADAGN